MIIYFFKFLPIKSELDKIFLCIGKINIHKRYSYIPDTLINTNRTFYIKVKFTNFTKNREMYFILNFIWRKVPFHVNLCSHCFSLHEILTFLYFFIFLKQISDLIFAQPYDKMANILPTTTYSLKMTIYYLWKKSRLRNF